MFVDMSEYLQGNDYELEEIKPQVLFRIPLIFRLTLSVGF
jgi:hypothetical protein